MGKGGRGAESRVKATRGHQLGGLVWTRQLRWWWRRLLERSGAKKKKGKQKWSCIRRGCVASLRRLHGAHQGMSRTSRTARVWFAVRCVGS